MGADNDLASMVTALESVIDATDAVDRFGALMTCISVLGAQFIFDNLGECAKLACAQIWADAGKDAGDTGFGGRFHVRILYQIRRLDSIGGAPHSE
jgi:hypothetical protein